MDTGKQIIDVLTSTKREGMDNMIDYLMTEGFFTSPASIRFHGCYEGGLAEHSWNVYARLALYFEASKDAFTKVTSNGQILLPVAGENLIAAGLLHDVCKIGAYIPLVGEKYRWNRAQPKGHALLSIKRILEFIKLEPIEEMMIKFHMGVYGLFEFEPGRGEYPLRGDKSLSKEERYGQSLVNAWHHNPVVKLMYFCDELAIFEEKGNL